MFRDVLQRDSLRLEIIFSPASVIPHNYSPKLPDENDKNPPILFFDTFSSELNPLLSGYIT